MSPPASLCLICYSLTHYLIAPACLSYALTPAFCVLVETVTGWINSLPGPPHTRVCPWGEIFLRDGNMDTADTEYWGRRRRRSFWKWVRKEFPESVIQSAALLPLFMRNHASHGYMRIARSSQKEKKKVKKKKNHNKFWTSWWWWWWERSEKNSGQKNHCCEIAAHTHLFNVFAPSANNQKWEPNSEC